MELEYRKALPTEADAVCRVVQDTKAAVYPKYYIKEVVEFFGRLHSLERIRADVEAGKVFILLADGVLAGTGSYDGNHITRVYVLPEYEGRGLGSYILRELERDIFAEYDACELDASLPACIFYEKRGYRTVRHVEYDVGGGNVMVYEVMRKEKCST